MQAFAISIIGFITMVMCVACASDSPDKSPIDDMSDEVYEQIVQHYFFAKTQLEMLLGELGDDIKMDSDWITEHELFEDAQQYAEKDNLHPVSVFPNPLPVEYIEDPSQYTETEQTYIEKLLDFMDASSRAEMEEFERLKKELKDELEIKDSYNIFAVEE